jgi:hypothetical protein
VLAIPPGADWRREFYFSEGYILLEAIVGDAWVKKLRDATEEMVERSRKVTRSDTVFDLEPDHRPDAPRLRRVSNPTEQHPVFSEYVNHSVLPDAVADPSAPNVKSTTQAQLQSGPGRGRVEWRHDSRSGRTERSRRSPSAPNLRLRGPGPRG